MRLKYLAIAPLVLGSIFVGCSDDEGTPDESGGSGGSAGANSGGSAGTSAGAPGGSGSAGMPGASGSGGTPGSAGAAGMPGGSGAAGAAAADAGTGMTFFVTSRGVGAEGGNFGGLEGADALCDALATAVGEGDRTWHAFLSTNDEDARDRIGDGPWQDVDGNVIAESVTALFADGIPQVGRDLIDETGATLANNIHDIVTGTNQDGTGLQDLNCNAWTSNAATDQTVVGHSNGMGPQGVDSDFGWIRAHTNGNTNCNQAGLAAGGGDGRIYCFAAD